jgi:hypothetical protein
MFLNLFNKKKRHCEKIDYLIYDHQQWDMNIDFETFLKKCPSNKLFKIQTLTSCNCLLTTLNNTECGVEDDIYSCHDCEFSICKDCRKINMTIPFIL